MDYLMLFLMGLALGLALGSLATMVYRNVKYTDRGIEEGARKWAYEYMDNLGKRSKQYVEE